MADNRVLLFLAAVTVAAATSTRWHELEKKGYSFDMYLEEFSKSYSSAEYTIRKEIFDARLRAIKLHNKDTTKTWKEGVNHMTDYTTAELKAMRGYKKSLAYSRRGSGLSMSALQSIHSVNQRQGVVDILPKSVDWRLRGAVSPVKDQGVCGSCWTFAAAETVESHWFLQTGNLKSLSEQQIASCTANPRDCGGNGGCNGGIAELAFDSIVSAGGLASEWTYPYRSYFGEDFKCIFNATKMKPQAKLKGHQNNPSNQYAPLMQAIANLGPIAISVDANLWNNYEEGVYDGCNQTNPDLDHAVQLVGYGTTQQGVDYWIVRNSWSTKFGERGYIRLRRYSNLRCGTDLHPTDGDGCVNGPSSVKVCGTCGILYDSTMPIVNTGSK